MWRVFVPEAAAKSLARFPARDADRLWTALKAMERDPYAGHVLKLAGATYRRRVGNYRIIFDIDPAVRFVRVKVIERRTTTTYRRR